MATEKTPAILHLIDTTGPGGAETVFTQLADYTRNLGYKTVAVVRGEGWVYRELKRLDIPTYILDSKGSFNLKFLMGLIKIIRSQKINVIQTHLLGSNVYGCIAGLITRVPVFCTFHGFVDISKDEKFKRLKFFAVKLGAKNVIAVTKQMSEALGKLFVTKNSKLRTIANGVDTKTFCPGVAADLRNEHHLSPSTLVIGCLGNVRTAKNYQLAINTLKELRASGIDAVLFIAGDNKNRLADELREHAQAIGVNTFVIWLGFVKDTPAYLNALNIFLLSSSSEGHPLAVNQAMAVGVPIVSTRCGVEELLVHKQTAMFAEKNDASGLAQQIIALMDDNELRQIVVENAQRESRDKLSLNAMCEQYVSLYTPYLS